MELKTDYKWIEFVEVPTNQQTKKFNVCNKETEDFLGQVKWHGGFRKYSFFPASANLVFESTCLRDIASFLDQLMLERKLAKQNSQQ